MRNIERKIYCFTFGLQMVNISGAWWTVVIFSCIQKRPNNDYSLLCFFKKKKKKQTTKINVGRTFKKKIAHNALQCKTALVLIKPSTCFCISTNSRIQPDGAYCHVLFRSIVSSQAAEARETYFSGVDWRPTERFLLPFFSSVTFFSARLSRASTEAVLVFSVH